MCHRFVRSKILFDKGWTEISALLKQRRFSTNKKKMVDSASVSVVLGIPCMGGRTLSWLVGSWTDSHTCSIPLSPSVDLVIQTAFIITVLCEKYFNTLSLHGKTHENDLCLLLRDSLFFLHHIQNSESWHSVSISWLRLAARLNWCFCLR